nr:hypothetical protein [Tanacetum cinerariifolium]
MVNTRTDAELAAAVQNALQTLLPQIRAEILEEFRIAAGTTEEQAKNFQWGLRKSTLNYLMCIPFTDVAQVANAARNYEILHKRDDDDAERPDKRQKSGDRHQPTTQQSSHRNHGHNNDCHGSDRRGSGDNHHSNNNYSSNNNRLNFKSIRSSSTHEHDPNITADKKPGASGRVFTITEDHATKTSGHTVNTCTDADLSAAVQNALQTLLPQIRAEIREEFRTSFGPSDSGGNPPPVTIYTWLERFNKQKPRSFEKATAPVDADNWISHMEKIFVQTNTETSTEFMRRFLRLAGFLGAAAGTEEEQEKNFQWGLRRSTLNHLMCMSYTDVAQVANAARNYEIHHERDDDDAERPDKRQKSGDRHQPTTQQSSHRNHGHNNDRHGSDRRGSSDNYRSSNNNYSGNNNRLNFKSIRSSSTHKHDPNITVLSSPGVPLMATPTQFALRVDADTQESIADKKPGASGRVFAITEDHATKTSATTQQSSHRNHGHNNDRHGLDRRGGGDNHRSNNNYSGNNNRSFGNGRDQRNRGQQSNRPVNSGFQQSRGPSKGYSYPVCTTCGRRHPGECRRAAGTCFKCGQTSHLQKDCKKNTAASISGQADKKPGASGRVFAITEDHATKTSGFLATIYDTTSDVPSIHDQPIVSEFPDVFPDELSGIPL